jgi:predicted Zn-dependent peptidase
VVGDFNQEEMVKTVKEKFSAIPAAKNPRPEKIFRYS